MKRSILLASCLAAGALIAAERGCQEEHGVFHFVSSFVVKLRHYCIRTLGCWHPRERKTRIDGAEKVW